MEVIGGRKKLWMQKYHYHKIIIYIIYFKLSIEYNEKREKVSAVSRRLLHLIWSIVSSFISGSLVFKW